MADGSSIDQLVFDMMFLTNSFQNHEKVVPVNGTVNKG